jgi:RNA polymerase-binding transcription factor DksA
MAVSQELARLLARQSPTMADVKLPQEQKPGLKPEERLRLFLDSIERARSRLGTPEWGRCQECGQPLPDAALEDTPWLEVCARCAAE